MKPHKRRLTDLILETVPEAIAWKDVNSVYQGANIQFAKAAGFDTSEEIIGKTDEHLSWKKYANDYMVSDRQVLDSGKPVLRMIEYYHHTDRDDLWLQLSLLPLIDNDNKSVGILVVFQDISEDMKAKQALYDAKDNLEQKVAKRTEELSLSRNDALEAKEEAEVASQAKSQFLSSMSHELRTPLNAILGFSQLMQMEYEEIHQSPSEDIGEIVKAGNHLLRLINDVLDLAKIEAGAITLSLEPVNVKTVIEECFTLSSSLTLQENITLSTQIKNQENPFIGCEKTVVAADRLRLKQVLLNLITNAIKYNTKNGFVTVSCQDLEDNNKIRILIEDTGRGLDEHQQKKLFTAFERLGIDSEGIDGTGIGLMLTKQLTEQMNGVIGFKSQLGIGSQFWIDLPKAYSEAKLLEQKTKITISSPHKSLKTVLYIEDNPSNMFVMKKIFKSCFPQWELMTATESVLGLSMAKDQQPDLILLDINLPILDGYAVYERLQQSEETSHIPVIAVTALAMTTDIEKGKNAGFVDYISKPIDIELLTNSINRIFPEY